MTINLRTSIPFFCLLFLITISECYSQPAPPSLQQPVTPQTAPQAGATQKPATQAPAAPADDSENTGDGQFSVEPIGWWSTSAPLLRGGKLDANTDPSTVQFASARPISPGILVNVPAGKFNTLRFSYFQTQRSSYTTVGQNLAVFGVAYAPADVLATDYKLQNAKVSWDYLSYPFPIKGHKFRLKTLWEVQYTTIHATIDAPLKTVVNDSSGNPISNSGAATRWFILPTLGLAMEYSVSKNFRFEAKASGFGIPHHAATWDAEAAAAIRAHHIEVLIGGRAFYFKTTPQQEDYLSSRLWGPFAGIRWYSK